MVLSLLIAGSASSLAQAARPIVVSGQSGAENLTDFFHEFAPEAIMEAHSNQAITYWDDGQLGWQSLRPHLTPQLGAFVWFQGEQEARAGVQNYEALLRTFIGRVRAAAQQPDLFVVIVQILAYTPPPPEHNADDVRRAQRAFVASDPHSVLINVDDLPTDGRNHVKLGASNTEVTRRILAAIHTHR